MENITTLFKLSSYLTSKKKERFEIILEPLQALIQLSLLSYCPPGAKLSISNNLLIIQSSSWNQSFIRSYNSDTKDDIFFLFSVIKRFNKFYSYMNKIPGSHSELFNKMIDLSVKGIDKLLLTYSNTSHQQLLHTLKLYKTLLIKPEAFDVENIDDNKKINKNNDKSSDKSIDKTNNTANLCPNLMDNKDNIDEIFINITKVYTENHIKLLNNIFNLLESDQENYEIYIEAINTILNPINFKIKKWINENIIF